MATHDHIHKYIVGHFGESSHQFNPPHYSLDFRFLLGHPKGSLLCLVIKGVMREAVKAPSHITVNTEDQHIAPQSQERAGTKKELHST